MIPAVTGSSEAALLASTPKPNAPRFDAAPAARVGPEEVAAARNAARRFVGEVFFGMLLKEMRKTAAPAHPLHGGHGEDVMRPQFDQALVERLARARAFDLADEMVSRFYRDTPYSNICSADSLMPGGAAREVP